MGVDHAHASQLHGGRLLEQGGYKMKKLHGLPLLTIEAAVLMQQRHWNYESDRSPFSGTKNPRHMNFHALWSRFGFMWKSVTLSVVLITARVLIAGQ
ncbi:hypothetical protein D3C80_1896830 [compost metagenome]